MAKMRTERETLEAAKRQYLSAQSGAVKAAQMAKEMADAAAKRLKEASELAEKAIAAAKEADAFAAITKRLQDFDSPIRKLTELYGRADAIKGTLQKDLHQTRARQDELKKEGIAIDFNKVAKTPSRMSI